MIRGYDSHNSNIMPFQKSARVQKRYSLICCNCFPKILQCVVLAVLGLYHILDTGIHIYIYSTHLPHDGGVSHHSTIKEISLSCIMSPREGWHNFHQGHCPSIVLVSTCVGQVRLSFISKCLFIQAFTKGPKASPGFLIEHRCLFARFKEE